MIRLLTNMDFPGAPAPDLQRQPAGFDLSVRKVATLQGAGRLDLTNAERLLPTEEELFWPRGGGAIKLSRGAYLVTYNEVIAVPEDCAGIVLPRSSLMRCGAVLHSALWDPGYRGRGQGLLTVHAPLELLPNARIGQFVLVKLEQAATAAYDGQYQGENL